MQPMNPPDDSVLGPRDTVTVAGADAQRFLQSQLSQDIDPLAVGDEAWTLVLTPNGKVSSLARVVRVTDDRFDLITDAGFGQALADRLAMFKIRVDVDIEVVSDGRAEDADGHPSGDEGARIAAGWPRLGREIIPGETLPAGLGLNEVAISFTKGCYPGQELVERMDSRGVAAPHQLQMVEVAADAQPGDPVLSSEGDEIGVLTSVAGHQGLAWVRRGSADEVIDS